MLVETVDFEPIGCVWSARSTQQSRSGADCFGFFFFIHKHKDFHEASERHHIMRGQLKQYNVGVERKDWRVEI